MDLSVTQMTAREFSGHNIVTGPLSGRQGWEISGQLHGFFQKIACLAKRGFLAK